jgi:hypothetical protein
LDTTARKNTLGVNWPSACDAGNVRKLAFSGIINVDSTFFQEGSGFPPINGGMIPSDTCGDTTQPFAGTFDSNLLGNMTTPGGTVDLSQDFTAILLQAGTALSGTWNASNNTNGSVTGTINGRNLTNASMTWTGGCTGNLTGDFTISDDGCLLTGTLSGALSGSMTNPADGSSIPCGPITVNVEGYKQ